MNITTTTTYSIILLVKSLQTLALSSVVFRLELNTNLILSATIEFVDVAVATFLEIIVVFAIVNTLINMVGALRNCKINESIYDATTESNLESCRPEIDYSRFYMVS